ncbi:MAG: hypothetical protein ACYC6N_08455 [Pirellulaceae bacterium]
MFYEDVQITDSHPTIDKLVWRYGHRTTDWESIWNHRKNIELRVLRATHADMKPGDILHIPIPWRVTSTPMSTHANGVEIRVNRNGGRGLNLRFVQTVNRANQPFGPPDVFCTDPCTPDDPAGGNEPFYRTRAELQTTPAWRKQLYDRPSRGAPSAVAGTTRWRAVTSIACVTGKRITIFDTKVWGFNLTPAGVVTIILARDASAAEIAGHLNLLQNSAGGNFRSSGWTFRLPPVDQFGDFNISDTVARTA